MSALLPLSVLIPRPNNTRLSFFLSFLSFFDILPVGTKHGVMNLLPSHLTVHPSHLQSLKKQNEAKNTKNNANVAGGGGSPPPKFAWDSHVIVEQVVANVAGVRRALRNMLFRGVNRLFSKWWLTSRG
jgi:hypothetical protein